MPDDDRDEQPFAALSPAPELIERARAFRDSGAGPAPAKPSATVLLLRDSDDGLEVFMIRRVVAMAFAGGMHVFPGGGVDPADARGRDPDSALLVAAIRETFEESGLLLASGTADAVELERDRLALIEHHATLDALCTKHNLVLRAEWLRPWSHWTTPDFEPRRYDTRFFVAVAPDGQDARHVGGESDSSGWVTPSKALAAQANGEWLLMPPTELTLRELLPFHSATEVFEAAERRDVRPLHARIDLDVDPPRFVFRPEQGDR